jgi:hypothetical protein
LPEKESTYDCGTDIKYKHNVYGIPPGKKETPGKKRPTAFSNKVNMSMKWQERFSPCMTEVAKRIQPAKRSQGHEKRSTKRTNFQIFSSNFLVASRGELIISLRRTMSVPLSDSLFCTIE